MFISHLSISTKSLTYVDTIKLIMNVIQNRLNCLIDIKMKFSRTYS